MALGFFSDEPKNAIQVVKAGFDTVVETDWEELFDGFATLKAITYSSSMDFICKLIPKFELAEIIFGCEDIISYRMQEVIAFQSRTIEKLKETAKKNSLDLIERIEAGKLRLNVSRTMISHEKTYLLKTDDGRCRVVTGSANLSKRAFTGGQRENIIVFDDSEAYEHYCHVYEQLKECSSDEITTKCMDTGAVAIDIADLPIAQTVIVKKALVLEPVKEAEEDIKFLLDTRNLAAKLAPHMPGSDKEGKTLLAPETIKRVKRTIADVELQQKSMRNEYPELIADVQGRTMTLNGLQLDLDPPSEEIAQDAVLFLDYLEGFSRFHGDIETTQQRYFEFANWFLVTPFLSNLRLAARGNNKPQDPYPIFGLLTGESKAGKTSFLETLLKMMTGQKVKMAATNFTKRDMAALRATVKGVPIIVDDMVQNRFREHAVEVIKDDDFQYVNSLAHCPAIAISANEDVKTIGQEITRRTVIARVTASLKNTELMRSNTVPRIQKKMTTAFYREYLRRIMDRMPDILGSLNDEDAPPPDIFPISSETILAMLREYQTKPIPPFIRVLSLDDYFDEKRTAHNTIRLIREAWRTHKERFQISKKDNKIDYTQKDDQHAINRMYKDLPEDVRLTATGDCITMDLEKSKEFFGVNFKKPLFGR